MNQDVTTKRVLFILDVARAMAERDKLYQVEEIQLHHGYSEPGYDAGKTGLVAIGNWNNITRYNNETRSVETISTIPSRLRRMLEAMGVSIEWGDEWTSCHDCGKVVRTQGDHYSWKPSYVVDEEKGTCLCAQCIQEEAAEYLASLEGNENRCNTLDSIDPADYDYVQVSEHESGFYGKNDNPAEIAKSMISQGINRFLFNLDHNEQYRTKWTLYVHSEEVAKAKANNESSE